MEEIVKDFIKYNKYNKVNLRTFEQGLLRFIQLNDLAYEKDFFSKSKSERGTFYAKLLGKKYIANSCYSCWGELR